METKHNDIAAENKELKRQLEETKLELWNVIGQLNVLRAMYGLPTYEAEKAQKSQQAICKVISINQ